MKKQQTITNNSQFVGFYFLSYLLICGFVTGSVLVPALFFLWLLLGWKISRFFCDLLVIGEESIKFTASLFIYFIVLAVLSYLGLN